MSRCTVVDIYQGCTQYGFATGNRDWAEELGLKVGETHTWRGQDALDMLREGYKADRICDFDYTIAMMLMGMADKMAESGVNDWDERDYEVKFAEQLREEIKVTVLYSD